MRQKQQNNASLQGFPIHAQHSANRDDAAICLNRYNFGIVQLFDRLPRRCPTNAGLLLAMTADYNSRNVSD